MKVKILNRAVFIPGNRSVNVGEVVELDELSAKFLISIKNARKATKEEIEKANKPPADKTPKKS